MTTEVVTTEKRMFSNIDADKREAALSEMAFKSEPSMVKVPFTGEELTTMRHNLSEISIRTQDAERLKAQALKEYTANIKLIDTQRRSLINDLKLGYIEKEEMLYGLDNQDSGMMEYYDKEGVLQYERRLLPDERQTRIK